ncbi:MAG TPA: erythrose-4-phosphate dehydrogenase, partial [Parvularculaceae bacterium]|nr:erythrose-4-phosphate dehydrogenase [Parvularculaceae bacterium]
SSIRVPTPNVSVIDLVFTPKRDTTVEEVNGLIMEAANGPMKGVLGYTDKPLVSIDFNHDPHSSTFALSQTQILEGKLVRVLSWYDNEWGFSTRMSDTALEMAKFL